MQKDVPSSDMYLENEEPNEPFIDLTNDVLHIDGGTSSQIVPRSPHTENDSEQYSVRKNDRASIEYYAMRTPGDTSDRTLLHESCNEGTHRAPSITSEEKSAKNTAETPQVPTREYERIGPA